MKTYKGQCGIYKITCIPTGKFYIGSTVNVSNRIIRHKWDLKANRHLNKSIQNSWNKYGEVSFKFEVLEYCERKDQVKREQYYIDTLKPHFNILKQAFSSTGFKHSGRTVNSLRKLRSNKAKSVAQIDIKTLKVIKKWVSINQIVKVLGIERQSISMSCKFQRQYGAGYIWRYWDDRKKVSPIKKNGNYTKLFRQLLNS